MQASSGVTTSSTLLKAGKSSLQLAETERHFCADMCLQLGEEPQTPWHALEDARAPLDDRAQVEEGQYGQISRTSLGLGSQGLEVMSQR